MIKYYTAIYSLLEKAHFSLYYVSASSDLNERSYKYW